MITIRSKVYVSYLYKWIKVQMYNCLCQKHESPYIVISQGTIHFKYVSKE